MVTGGATLLARFAGLSSEERRLVVAATATQVALGVGLRLLPFGVVRRLVRRFAAEQAQSGGSVRRVAWAIKATNRRLPGITCLPQALAAQLLLARRGHETALRIGVRKDADFEAHSWVEYEGTPIVGDGVELDEYTSLSGFGE